MQYNILVIVRGACYLNPIESIIISKSVGFGHAYGGYYPNVSFRIIKQK